MVKEISKDGTKYFVCEECSFVYLDKETAQECEDYCNKYKSCNIEITKKAISKSGDK